MKTVRLQRRIDDSLLRCLFFEALNDQVGFRASLSDKFEDLINREVEMVSDPDVFRDLYWASESWSKYPFDIGIDREQVAYEKFSQAEEHCERMNYALVGWDTRPSIDYRLMARARRNVGLVLGEFSWDEFNVECSFGPGATTSLPRSKARQQEKWELATHITAEALPYYLAFSRFNQGWRGCDRELQIVSGNTVTTVPKNAKTDRVIAIEPDWNMFFQRAVGRMIRRRLNRKCGLLTPRSQYDNQNAAREGSLTGSLSTIDLSSASDSISLALCEALLPSQWFSRLIELRSPCGTVDGKTISYHKISSMGNGFTFELETLLFWALAKACCGAEQVLVYGDDIICPVKHHERVTSALEMCGFTVNVKKTFASGPFRESCGGHYHSGIEVTPPYFKEKIEDLPGVIRTGNRLRHYASQHGGWYLDGRFSDTWHYLAARVPKSFWGPRDLGDACFHAPFDMCRPTWDRHTQNWKVKTVLPVTERTSTHHWGAVYSSLWGRISEGSHVLHKRAKAYRIGTTIAGGRWDLPDLWVG